MDSTPIQPNKRSYFDGQEIKNVAIVLLVLEYNKTNLRLATKKIDSRYKSL